MSSFTRSVYKHPETFELVGEQSNDLGDALPSQHIAANSCQNAMSLKPMNPQST